MIGKKETRKWNQEEEFKDLIFKDLRIQETGRKKLEERSNFLSM